MRNVPSAVAIALCLSLAACGGGEAEEDAEVGNVSVTTDDTADGQITEVTGPNGERATIRSGEDVDVQFPEGFALVSGGRVENVMQFTERGQENWMISIAADMPMEELAAAYRAQAEAAGYAIEMTTTSADVHLIAGKKNEDEGFTFAANAGDGPGSSKGTLQVGSAPR